MHIERALTRHNRPSAAKLVCTVLCLDTRRSEGTVIPIHRCGVFSYNVSGAAAGGAYCSKFQIAQVACAARAGPVARAPSLRVVWPPLHHENLVILIGGPPLLVSARRVARGRRGGRWRCGDGARLGARARRRGGFGGRGQRGGRRRRGYGRRRRGMTLRPCVCCSPTSCSTASTASSASSDGGESRSGPRTPRALLVVALFLRQAHKRRPPLLLVVVRCVRHLPLSTKCVGAPRPRRSERADGTEKVGVLKEERLATERTERAGERGAGERVGGDKAP